jgi:hypothetical protein
MIDNMMSGEIELTDEKLQTIATRVLNTFKLAAEKGIAHHAEPTEYPMPTRPNVIEEIFLTQFQQLTSVQQRTGVAKVMESLNAPQAERRRVYGDLARISLRSATAVEDQVKAIDLPESLKLSPQEIERLAQQFQSDIDPKPVPGVVKGASQALATAQPLKKLELRIHKVKCLSEMDLELGADEILMGGSTIDAIGTVKLVKEFKVGNFRTGGVKEYSPPKQFAVFDLTKGDTFPRTYEAVVVLGEQDQGWFGNFLTQLMEKVKGEVIAFISAGLGGIIGSTIPGLGTVIGLAVGWIIGKLIGWLKQLWRDDVFPPKTVHVTIPFLPAYWKDKTDSPEGTILFSYYGGKYQVTYDWRMFS